MGAILANESVDARMRELEAEAYFNMHEDIEDEPEPLKLKSTPIASQKVPWFHRQRVPLKAGEMLLFDRVERAWRLRRCFVCQQYGWCQHREFDVEVAFLSGEWAI